jgi:hypothetical protein
MDDLLQNLLNGRINGAPTVGQNSAFPSIMSCENLLSESLAFWVNWMKSSLGNCMPNVSTSRVLALHFHIKLLGIHDVMMPAYQIKCLV